MTARPDSGTAGFTLVETLIALAISALVVALVLPMTTAGARRNVRLAERETFLAEQARAEAAFGAVLNEALLPAKGAAAQGSRQQLAVQVEGRSFPPCGSSARRGPARFFVQKLGEGGRLICELGGRPMELLRWQAGTGGFDYSTDGQQWQSAWPPAGRKIRAPMIDMRLSPSEVPPPVLVRFTIRRGDRPVVAWVASAGDPTATGQPL
jgi:prepilin-type N-terminal cleavage/methylation domain-containing protein